MSFLCFKKEQLAGGVLSGRASASGKITTVLRTGGTNVFVGHDERVEKLEARVDAHEATTESALLDVVSATASSASVS